MAWTVQKRNQLITAANDTLRNGIAAYHIKTALTTAGWTVAGSGYGTGGASGGWDGPGTDRWASAPVLDLAWIGLTNGDGVTMLLQTSGTSLKMYWLKGTYTGTGAATATLPDRGAIPAAEVADTGSTIAFSPYTNVDFYLQVVTEGTASFWAWAKNATIVGVATALIKCTDVKTADTNPYWSFRFGSISTSAFLTATISGAGTAITAQARHPTSGTRKPYPVLDLSAGSTPLFTSLPVDPNSSKEQLIDCLVGCVQASFYHLKGRLPGIVRCSTLRTVGDTFDSGVYVCVGEYALPWGTSLTPMI